MATNTIPSEAGFCQGARSAYFDASVVMDDLVLSLERLSEMTFALSASELFEENAQHSFYMLAKVAEQMKNDAKFNAKRYDENRKNVEAGQ